MLLLLLLCNYLCCTLQLKGVKNLAPCFYTFFFDFSLSLSLPFFLKHCNTHFSFVKCTVFGKISAGFYACHQWTLLLLLLQFQFFLFTFSVVIACFIYFHFFFIGILRNFPGAYYLIWSTLWIKKMEKFKEKMRQLFYLQQESKKKSRYESFIIMSSEVVDIMDFLYPLCLCSRRGNQRMALI